MQHLLRLLACLLALQASAYAQTKALSKTIATNGITEDFTVPSGRTVTFAEGSTLSLPSGFLNTSAILYLDEQLIAKADFLSLAQVASTGAYGDLQGAPSLSAIATSGNASDLENGTLPDARLSANVPLKDAANTFTAAAQIAPSWRLSAYAGSETIPADVPGIGYDGSGRFTIQSPVGALQLYSVGAPAVPTFYWPGNIVANTITATTNASLVSAANITTGLGSDALNSSVMTNSLVPPLRQWQGTTTQAGTAGIPTQTDAEGGGGGSTELIDGTYWPQAVVSGMTGASSTIAGLYRTSAQVRTDLAVPQVVAAPATATSTGTAGQIAYDASFFYVCTATNTWRRAALSTW